MRFEFSRIKLEISVLSSTMAAMRSTLEEMRSSAEFRELIPDGRGCGLGDEGPLFDSMSTGLSFGW